MKAIFTGTEQDLIECGFFENEYVDNIYLKYLVDTEIKLDSIMIDMNTRIITRHIKEVYMPEIACKKVAKSTIQDLIDKNLVRWE